MSQRRHRRRRQAQPGAIAGKSRTKTPSGARVVIFPVVLTIFPVLFFVLLEFGLRAAHYGVDTSLVLEVKEQGVHSYVLNPDVARRYFSPQMRAIQPAPGFRAFPVTKPRGGLRVFTLGESTTAGFPFHVNASYSGFLEDELHAAYPDRDIEIINCGMSAVNSFTVLDFTEQLVRYEPDLFIVYLGHNEFYGALGVGSASRSAGTRWITLLQMKLARLRTYQFLSDNLFRLRRSASGGAGRTLMGSMVREKRIRLEDPIHRKAEQNFRTNLNAILDVAEKHHVTVILSTLASNLRDLPPFDSAHRDGLPAADGKRQEDAVARSATLPVSSLEEAVRLDTTYAAARFVLGRALDRAGRYSEALHEYIGARDHDVVHFRACTPFNAIVREVAASRRVALVDMEAVFAERSPERIPGRNLFLEHLHPNLDGAILMADAYRKEMEDLGKLNAAQAVEGYASDQPQTAIDRAAITPLDVELARQRIAALTRQWPFDRAYAGLPFPYPAGTEDVRRMAERVLRKNVSLEKAHEALGRQYLQRSDLEHALPEFRALAKIFPVSPVGPQTAADILMQLQRPADAAPYYRQAIAVMPGQSELHWRLAVALRQSGDDAGALAECEATLALSPGHREATDLIRDIHENPAPPARTSGEPAATARAGGR